MGASKDMVLVGTLLTMTRPSKSSVSIMEVARAGDVNNAELCTISESFA